VVIERHAIGGQAASSSLIENYMGFPGGISGAELCERGQRQIPDISKKMLIQVIRSLEKDGLVERTVYPVVPPKTEYRLTDEGRLFYEPVAALCKWASDNAVFLDAVHERRRPKTK
jgi:DNA-binding MarR family transcriptional regulator